MQALLDLLHEPGFLVFALGHGEVRHVVRLGVELHVAAFSDFEGVLARAGNVAEQGVHFFCRAQVEVIRVELETLGVGEGRAGLHAQQRRVSGVVFLAGVVQVVGGDEGQVQLLGEAVQVLLNVAFNVQAVVHDLAVEVVLAENIAEFARRLDCLVELSQAQAGLHLAGGAAGGRNQALRVCLQHLAVHTRLVQLTFQRRNRGGTEQVVHALGGLSPHGHVGVRATAGDVVAGAVAPAHTRTVGTVRAGGQVRLHTDNGLDVVRFSLAPEVEGTKEEAVVTGRHGLHAEFFSVGEQVTQARSTVEHGVLSVHVQVRKFFGCHGYLLEVWAGGWAVNVKLCAAGRGRLCLAEFDVAVTQSGQRVGQVERVLAGEGYALAGTGVIEAQAVRVQPLAGQSQFGAKARVGAVGQVAAAGVAQCREVHTNLVGASGFQVHLHQGRGAEGLEHIVVGDRVAAVLDHCELPLIAGVTANGRVNGAAQRVGQALHERVVDLIYGAFLEGALELGVGAFAAGYDHQAAGAHVQAVHNALAFCRAGGSNRDALAHERGDDGGAVPAG